jgi:hypothetical protein
MADFIVKLRPEAVAAAGVDPKRSRYLAAAFRDLPDGYVLDVFDDPETGEPRGIEIRAAAPEPNRCMTWTEMLAALRGEAPAQPPRRPAL